MKRDCGAFQSRNSELEQAARLAREAEAIRDAQVGFIATLHQQQQQADQ